MGVALLLVSVGTIGAAWAINARYDKNIQRADLLGDVPTTTRTDESGSAYDPRASGIVGPLNFLVLGSDSRLTDPTVRADTVGERSDTMMLIHVTADLQSAYVVSLPRDSYVDVPAGGVWEGGKNKINAAFSYGGAPLAAKTVYELTGLPLDGAVVVDFAGVRTMVNAVGGVRVCTTYTVRSIHTNRVWKAGCNHMGGDSALDFMRQRYNVPGSDLGRIHNQQVVLQSLLSRAVSRGTLTNPLRFDSFLRAATGSITVDDNMDVQALALALRHLRPENMTFATLPVTSDSLWTPYGTAIEVDADAASGMFAAVNEDRLPEWQAERAAEPSSLAGNSTLVPRASPVN